MPFTGLAGENVKACWWARAVQCRDEWKAHIGADRVVLWKAGCAVVTTQADGAQHVLADRLQRTLDPTAVTLVMPIFCICLHDRSSVLRCLQVAYVCYKWQSALCNEKRS